MNILWHNVSTFGGLQCWLYERDLSIGDMAMTGPRIQSTQWEVRIDINGPDNQLVQKLDRTREDYLRDYRLCSVIERGDNLLGALRAALRKVDEMLGHDVPAKEGL